LVPIVGNTRTVKKEVIDFKKGTVVIVKKIKVFLKTFIDLQLHFKFCNGTPYVVFALIVLSSFIFSLSVEADETVEADEIKLIKLSAGVKYYEEEVRLGSRIEVMIDSVGWYLNRYDTEHLSGKTRVLTDRATKFYFNTKKPGEGYMIFSYLDKDIYLKIRIVKEGKVTKPGKGEPLTGPTLKTGTGGSEIVVEKEITGKEITGKEISGDKGKPVGIESAEGKLVSGLAISTGRDKIEKTEAGEIERKAKGEKAGREIESKVYDKEVLAGKGAPEAEKADLEESKNKAKKIEKNGTTARIVSGEDKPESVKPGSIYYSKDGKIKEIPAQKGIMDYFRNGKRFYKAGNYTKAVEALQFFLSKCQDCPEIIEAEFLLGEAFEKSEKEDEALTYYKKVVDNSEGLFRMKAANRSADILYKNKKYEQALRYYLLCEREKRAEGQLLERIGDIYFELENYQKALEYYLKLYSGGEYEDRIVYRIAMIYEMPGELKNIEKAYYYYNLIVENFSKSKYLDLATEKVEFYRKYFFEYK